MEQNDSASFLDDLRHKTSSKLFQRQLVLVFLVAG